MTKVVEQSVDRFGHLDIAVANASIEGDVVTVYYADDGERIGTARRPALAGEVAGTVFLVGFCGAAIALCVWVMLLTANDFQV